MATVKGSGEYGMFNGLRCFTESDSFDWMKEATPKVNDRRNSAFQVILSSNLPRAH